MLPEVVPQLTTVVTMEQKETIRHEKKDKGDSTGNVQIT